jgi:hypothetical protein
MSRLQQDDKPKTPGKKELPHASESSIVNTQMRNPDHPSLTANIGEAKKEIGHTEIRAFDSVEDLAGSKGYQTRQIKTLGIDIIAYRLVDVTGIGYTIDMILLAFVSRERPIRSGNAHPDQWESKPNGTGISSRCRQITDATRDFTTAILERDLHLPLGRGIISVSSLFQGLETCHANLLLGKVTYHRFNGRIVRFSFRPVLLNFPRQENEADKDKLWVPAQAVSRESNVDIVNLNDFASYLDFRDKEVKTIGAEELDIEAKRGCFPSVLRQFRLITAFSALMMLASLLTYAIGIGTSQSVPYFIALLGVAAESLGGWRLISSCRDLRRKNKTAYLASPAIASENIVDYEAESSPAKITSLHSKRVGSELPGLKNESQRQRIIELTMKAKEILGKIEKLENREFYSEVVLSIDRSTRYLMMATLNSIGVETQGRDIMEWIPQLRKTIPSIQLEGLKSLWMLSDRINKGHDATTNEAREAKRIAWPVITDALEYLSRFLGSQDLKALENKREKVAREIDEDADIKLEVRVNRSQVTGPM